MQTKNEGGFTLVELLLVIVILGILAAIVVAAVGNTSTQASTNACTAEVKTIRSSLERAVASNPALVKTQITLTNAAAIAGSTQVGSFLADTPGACAGGLTITGGVVSGTP